MSVYRLTRLALIFPLAFAAGCSDYTIHRTCDSTEPSFDIEEVSTLEDAAGGDDLWWWADAVVLDYDTESLPEGGAWRVLSIDVLAMIPQSQFDNYPTEQELAVEVYSQGEPDTSEPWWDLTQTLEPSLLDWEQHTLTQPTELATETDYHRAWWRFDFSELTYGQGAQNPEFVVGIRWPDESGPEVAYSAFNRPCDRNWTVFAGESQWEHNSDQPLGPSQSDGCSWPMFRVNTGVTWEAEDCN